MFQQNVAIAIVIPILQIAFAGGAFGVYLCVHQAAKH